MLKTATIVGLRHRSRTLLNLLSFTHFLKTFSHHSVLFYVFSFSLLSFNSSIYSSLTTSKRDATVTENVSRSASLRPRTHSFFFWTQNIERRVQLDAEKN